MLTLPIGTIAAGLFWIIVNYAVDVKKSKVIKKKIAFIKDCQARVISLADGRKLKNISHISTL